VFETLLELVELFCGCVWSLKEAILLGTTASQSIPVEDLPHTCTQSLGLPGLLSGSRWNVASCSTLRYFVDSSLMLLASATAVPITCLLVFVCLVSFVLLSPRVSLPPCHQQVVSLHACHTPEVGRVRSERAEMAGSVYQTGKIRHSIPHCLPRPAFSDGFPGV